MELKEVKEKLYRLTDDQFLLKGKKKYKIVYPITKDQSKKFGKGNIHWKRFLIGSWGNLIKNAIMFGLMVFLIFSYMHDTEECREILSDPLGFCNRTITIIYPNMPQIDLNEFEFEGIKKGG